jgi:hypothetical protein
VLVRELFETEDPYKAKGLDHAVEKMVGLLKAECGDIVKAYQEAHGATLIRGIKEATPVGVPRAMHDSPEQMMGKIRHDRRPLWMQTKFHDLISDVMEEDGYASRRNSLFCTTDFDTADSWGVVYTVFLKDGWHGMVFDKVKKGYAFDELYGTAAEIFDQEPNSEERRKEKMREFITTLEPRKFTSPAGLANVLREGFDDILITGTDYYAIKSGTKLKAEIFRALGIQTHDDVEWFEPKKKLHWDNE